MLSEDSSSHAFDVVRALVKKMLLLVDDHAQTHRVRLEPANDSAKRAMRGNLWKSTRPADHMHKVDLTRAIATQLLQANNTGFVVLHVDGDRRWSERASSENVAKFDVYRTSIQRTIDELAFRQRPVSSETASRRKASAIGRLFLLVPFYSIESWLYQNVEEAIRICSTELRCGRHVAELKAWRMNRALLDEVTQPKEHLCLRDRYNLRLATQGYPSREVLAAGASFASVVEAMRRCEDLVEALRHTAER